MASPYNGYTHDPVQRAPSPYQPQYGPDPTQGTPSPYTPSSYEQGSSYGYYDQHPQANGQAYNNQGDQQYNGSQPQYDGPLVPQVRKACSEPWRRYWRTLDRQADLPWFHWHGRWSYHGVVDRRLGQEKEAALWKANYSDMCAAATCLPTSWTGVQSTDL
ncbi:hypothetical protein LTR96_011598 [Exophiala xenobiotica]|nr:hypothetical protein LTR72_011839 [Exophiala xenobiotica]KAK5262951.1 hypothetical protein LTR96_011598 [Exophiala xenobiotica]KAK5284410.1 hypothetical protein LTR14_011707 [Exophiala xenobiotica]KAK5332258.1 hypothetical protein LTR98_011606 [Exophiala xenobiotica]KAK5463797.1 hypothetical protein LTR55_011810 [Exophiala xenobiotica]